MKKIPKVWKKVKGKVAFILAFCCLAGSFKEMPFPGVYASEQEAEKKDIQPSEDKVEEAPASVSATEPAQKNAKEGNAGIQRAAVDRTDDIQELKLLIEEFYILDTENKALPYKTQTSGGNTVYDVSEQAYYGIGKVKLKLSFAILKAYDGGRQLREGDYILYRIPEGFRLDASIASGMIEFGGVPIAAYEKSTDTSGEILKFTFQEAVNAEKAYNNISGGMNLAMDFDSSALEGKDKVVQLFPPRGGTEPGVQIKLPQEPTTVDGITKEGIYNSSDNTITWSIKIGTEKTSKGVSVDGLIVEDIMGANQSYMAGSAVLLKTDGTPEGSVTVTEAGNTLNCVLQGNGVKAPCTLELKTAITQARIEEAANVKGITSETFLNAVTMEAPTGGSLSVGAKNHAEGTVDVTFGAQLSKEGKQIDSNTIHWIIEVNNTQPKVHVYHGVVTDTLMQGLSYKPGTMTYQTEDDPSAGIQGTTDGTVSPWPNHSLQIIGDSTTGQVLKFYMQSDTKKKYKIEFDTTVEEDFAGITDAQGNVVVVNNAVVEAELPYWTGTGPHYIDWDYGIPEVSCQFDASMLEKKVEADKKTGILTWTVLPSTRTGDYDYAEMTDVIENKQQYIDNSVKVEKKDGTSSGQGIVSDYDITAKKLTIKIPKSAGTPGEYKITYETKALNYFFENNTEQNYTNTAVLNIMKDNASKSRKEASASVKMKNPFLAKNTSFAFDSDKGYFHYTIDVNANEMSLNQVIVKDTISGCTFTAKDALGGETQIPSSNWEFDQSMCKTMKGQTEDISKKPQVVGDEVMVNLGTISEKYTIHLYAKLKDSSKPLLTDLTGSESLANKKVYSTNTVQAASDEVAPSSGNFFASTSRSAEENVCMDNTLVDKSVSSFQEKEGTITWQVVINPHGGPLANPVVEDKLPKAAKYETDSVKLYKGKYTNNKLVKGALAAFQPTAVFQVDKDYRYMTVDLSSLTDGPYLLEYKTVVVDASQQSVSNEVSVKTGQIAYGTSVGKKELSGGNWGTLSTAGKLEITKYDASVGVSMPLADAEFTVYSDEACTDPVDMGATDAKGKLVFYGLEAGTTDAGTIYYCKETKPTSDGYIANDKIYQAVIKRGKKTELTVENKRKEIAGVDKVDIVKQYSHSDDAGSQQITTGYQSEFELYFYPYGSSNTKVNQLVSFLEQQAGTYYYSNAALGTVSILKNSTADGKITFYGLPWGYYGLKETKSAEGFIPYSDMKYFEIGYQENTDSFAVEYSFNSGDKTDNKITNQSTSFYVKKLLVGTTNYLPDVKLQICTKQTDGTLKVEKNPVTGVDYEWVTTASEAAAGHLVKNLPAGSYVLHEVKEGTDVSLILAADIPFTLEKEGGLQQEGQKVTELTMYNARISLTIRKEDQFKEEVNGAEITVTGPDANSSTGYHKTVTTANGQAVFGDLIRGGIYQVSETTVPDGYGKAKDVTFQVSEDGTKLYVNKDDGTQEKVDNALTMVDRKLLVELKLCKTDAFTGKELKGAEFALYRKADVLGGTDTKLLGDIQMTEQGIGEEQWIGWDIAQIQDSIFNPFTGKPLKKGLDAGTYYLSETKIPEGYKAALDTEFDITGEGGLQLDSQEHAFISEHSQEKIQIKDEPLTLRIEKYDAENNDTLTGTEYTVSGIFAGESSVTFCVLTTTASLQKNELSGKFVPGNIYKIEETKAPAGYLPVKAGYFKLDALGNITVTDSVGAEALRTEIKAVNPKDEAVGTDGALQIFGEKLQVDFVKCTSEDGSQIGGAEFIITGTFADGETKKTLSANAEVPTELKGQMIEGNTYELTEVPPTGYFPLTGNVSFTYTANAGLQLAAGSDSHAAVIHGSDSGPYPKETLVITNDSMQNTTLQFLKYDKEDSSGIPDTVFELSFVPEGGTETQTTEYTIPAAGTVYEYVTAGEEHQKITASGEGFLTELKRGTYTLKEKTPAYAYQLGNEGFSISFTVDDRAKNKTIVINRTNLESHAFDLQLLSGGVHLTEKGIENDRMTGTVTLVKVDALDKTKHLNGVGFTVYRYKDSSNVLDWFRQFFTGKVYEVAAESWNESAAADGTLTIEGLPWGRYYIVETSTLDKYVLDQTKYEFSIGKDRLSQVLDWTPGKEITNAKVQMSIQQLTSSGKVTMGARMRMFGRFASYPGEYLEWTIGTEPYIVAGELLEGKIYTLEEISSMEGYTSAKVIKFQYFKSGLKLLNSGNDVEFSIAADGTFQLVQKVKPIRVGIKKVDEENNMLLGAKLELSYIKADGTSEIIKKWVSTRQEMSMEGILKAGGTYVLKETKAPKGYELAEDIKFQVEDMEEWQYITMTDKKEDPKKDDSEPEDPKKDKPDKEDPKKDKPDKEDPKKDKPDKNKPEQSKPQNPSLETGKQEGSEKKILPKTGKEVREIYYVIGVLFILIGMVLFCRKNHSGKRQKNKK